jgi:hypothetical protein
MAEHGNIKNKGGWSEKNLRSNENIGRLAQTKENMGSKHKFLHGR